MTYTTVADLSAFFSEPAPQESQVEQTTAQEVEKPEAAEPTNTDEPEVRAPQEESVVGGSNPDDEEDDEELNGGENQRKPFEEEEFTVTVNGQEQTVTGAELRNGYMRHATFTKRTQELAQERRALAAERESVIQQAGVIKFQSHTKLGQFDAAIQQAGGWEKLRATYPPEQVEQFTNMYVQAQKDAQAADAITAEYVGKQKEQNKREISEIFKQMGQTIHGFNAGSLAKMDAYLADNGFTEDMALAITHPQAWEMIYKAMMYDEAQSRGKRDDRQTTQAKVDGKRHQNVPATPVPTDNSRRKLDKAIERQKKAGGRGRAGEQATVDALATLFKP